MPDPDFALDRARVAVVYNPNSGKKQGEAAAQAVAAALRPVAAAVTLKPFGKGVDLVDLARTAARDHDLIVAAGGDGTQAGVAQALAGSDAVMGVVPVGTFNYFARDLEVGETAEEAIATLLTGAPARVTVADLNGTVFLNNVSLGAYPAMLARREEAYSRWGRSRLMAYVAGLWALRDLRRPVVLHTDVAGERRDHRSALVFAARSARQLEGLGLDGAEAIRDGHIVLYIAKAQRPWPLLKAALRLAMGRSARGEDFEVLISDAIEIDTKPRRRAVAHDGERSRLSGPFRLTMRPDALRVMLPR